MYQRPAEWGHKKTIWLAWPSHEDLWQENLEKAQSEFLHLVAKLKHERLVILFCDDSHQKNFLKQAGYTDNIQCKIIPYGDIWLRDTLPMVVKDQQNKSSAVIPKFNGWGNKYLFAQDVGLAAKVARELKLACIDSKLTFEGGAIECNGEGTLITTEQCLLNANRNPMLSKEIIEQEFARIFGAKKTIWLKNGLLNDHTDGHVDTIARFIAPNKIAIMMPSSSDDINHDVLHEIKSTLETATDVNGKSFSLVTLPSPGKVLSTDKEILPASYLNFIIGDSIIVMPTYGTDSDDEALSILSSHFDLPVTASSARAILSGGGAFHCISQEIFD